MTGLILDAVLMLLLVAALAYGVRLDRKLGTLRAGQEAFAGAVKDLNLAAARAESALGSLRASGQETDLLHDRILKARAVKLELEGLIARQRPSLVAPLEEADPAPISTPMPTPTQPARASAPAARAERLLVNSPLREPREPAPVRPEPAANQVEERFVNRGQRMFDEDLFAV